MSDGVGSTGLASACFHRVGMDRRLDAAWEQTLAHPYNCDDGWDAGGKRQTQCPFPMSDTDEANADGLEPSANGCTGRHADVRPRTPLEAGGNLTTLPAPRRQRVQAAVGRAVVCLPCQA
eukprot:scaffold30374_cov107-Isochrysis_galbana.AAC.13